MSHKKRVVNATFLLFLFLIFFLLLITISGWTNPQDDLFPITIIDDSGTEVTLHEKPERIISTAPSNTEIIFALGLEGKLVGRSEFCNYPPEVEAIESIGKMSPLNLEKIISLKPDLIFGYGGFQTKDIPRLRELGFKVIVIERESLAGMLQSIQLIATASGIPEEGRQLTANLQERIDRIASLTSQLSPIQKPKVFTGSSYETIWSPGQGTLFHELITLAGGENIVGHLKGWVAISPELIAQAEPDIIIVPIGIMNPEEIVKIKNDLINHPGWSQVPAIKFNQIFTVNEDLFYRAGPRLVDGLELLYEIFSTTREK